MRGRYKVLLAVLGMAAAVVFVFWLAARPRGVFAAKYQGQNLLYWAGQYRHASDGPYGGLREAREAKKDAATAIRALATNNLPELARALNHNFRPREERIEAATSWLPRGFRDWLIAGPLADHAEERSNAARFALVLLGPDAAPAIPEIEKLILGPDKVVAGKASYLVLPYLGTNSVPWLLTLMADENHPRRVNAMESFCIMASFTHTNTNPMALPILLRGLQSNHPDVVLYAAAALGSMQQEPVLCVPALTSALTNVNPQVRSTVNIALGKFHENARAALPGLVRTPAGPASDVGFQPVGLAYQVQGQPPPGTYTNTAPASAVPSVRELLFDRPGLPGAR